jgi:hypothetical protein
MHSPVGIAQSGYEPDDRGYNPARGTIVFLSTTSRPALGPTEPHIQWAQEAFLLE